MLLTYVRKRRCVMARTPRCRRIRGYPDYWSFAPQDEGRAEVIEMTLDEYECIRLMDREK